MTFSTKHYLWLGNVLLLGVVTWSGVGLGLSILEHRLEQRIGPPPSLEVRGGEVQSLKPLSRYETIITHNIFGGSQDKSTTPVQKEAPRTPTEPQTQNADVRLRGTIVDQDSGWMGAILEDLSTREQNFYRPGDRIGSSELVRVSMDYVIIRQSGQDVRIKLFDGDAGQARPAPRHISRAPVRRQEDSSQDDEPIAESVGPNAYVVSRDSLGKHMDNLNFFMSQVRILPYFKDGQPYGYRIASVRRNSPVQELGLRRGDVIVQVNGVSLNKPEDLMNLYRQVQQLESVSVELERGGQPLTLNYSLR